MFKILLFLTFRIEKRGNMKDPQLKFWTTSPNIFLVAATNSGNVVGCISYIHLNSTTVELCRIYVDEEFRRLGIGQKLVKTILEIAEEKGYKMVLVSTPNARLDARKLIEKMNFQFLGVIPFKNKNMLYYNTFLMILAGLETLKFKIEINK